MHCFCIAGPSPGPRAALLTWRRQSRAMMRSASTRRNRHSLSVFLRALPCRLTTSAWQRCMRVGERGVLTSGAAAWATCGAELLAAAGAAGCAHTGRHINAAHAAQHQRKFDLSRLTHMLHHHTFFAIWVSIICAFQASGKYLCNISRTLCACSCDRSLRCMLCATNRLRLRN
jgi:hypothetical protein